MKTYTQYVQDHGDPWTRWYRNPVSSKEQLQKANPSLHTCQHCSVIVTDLDIHGVKQDRVDVRRQLSITKDTVAIGAADGCPLLKLLRKGLHQAITNAGINGLVRALEDGTNYELFRLGILSKEEAVVYLAECLGRYPFHLRILDELYLFSVIGWASDWFLVTALPGTVPVCCVLQRSALIASKSRIIRIISQQGQYSATFGCNGAAKTFIGGWTSVCMVVVIVIALRMSHASLLHGLSKSSMQGKAHSSG